MAYLGFFPLFSESFTFLGRARTFLIAKFHESLSQKCRDRCFQKQRFKNRKTAFLTKPVPEIRIKMLSLASEFLNRIHFSKQVLTYEMLNNPAAFFEKNKIKKIT